MVPMAVCLLGKDACLTICFSSLATVAGAPVVPDLTRKTSASVSSSKSSPPTKRFLSMFCKSSKSDKQSKPPRTDKTGLSHSQSSSHRQKDPEIDWPSLQGDKR